jgi:hypothetical protein
MATRASRTDGHHVRGCGVLQGLWTRIPIEYMGETVMPQVCGCAQVRTHV